MAVKSQRLTECRSRLFANELSLAILVLQVQTVDPCLNILSPGGSTNRGGLAEMGCVHSILCI